MASQVQADTYLSIVASRVIVEEFPNIYEALREVLCKLPDDILEFITKDKPVFFYVMPPVIGMHTCYVKEAHEDIDLSKGFCPVFFRSELNSFDKPTIISIVAHEIAHAYMHSTLEVRPVEEKEKEADRMVSKWGFSNPSLSNTVKIVNLQHTWENPDKYWGA